MTPSTVIPVPVELVEAIAALWDESDVRIENQTKSKIDWTIPADLDRSRVQQRARAYLSKVPGAVSGNSGHDHTYHASCILVERYAMSPEEAYPLLAEWNDKCQPPWEPADLMRKLREVDEKETGPRGQYLRPLIRERRKAQRKGQTAATADPSTNGASHHEAESPPDGSQPGSGGEEPQSDLELRNFYDHEDIVDNRTVRVKLGYSMQHIAGQLRLITGGWPKRVGQLLFAVRGCRPVWIDSTAALFAWISSRMCSDRNNGIHWAEGTDKIKQNQLYEYLTQTVEEFETVELYPHEPMIPGHCYVCQPLAGGNGTAFNALLSRFMPSTEADGMLIRAFFLSLMWGGLPGQRPAWLFTGEAGDLATGRGVGKSTLAQIGARLVGGYVSLSSNESFGDVQRRLLSPVGLEKRVVLLDNIKSLRFSWGELEGLITDTVISGRQMMTGEGQRPNTLIWILTLNGASLSRDLAQRCVVVRLKRPTYVGSWMSETISFVDENRAAILGDIVEELKRQPLPLHPRSRWGSWEQEVLARLDDPQRCQDVIAERSMEADDDREEMETVREALRTMIRGAESKDPDEVWVHIPSHIAADIYNSASGEKRATNSAMKMIYMLGIPEVSKKTTSAGGRGCTWRGLKTTWQHARGLGEPGSAQTDTNADESDLF